MHDIKNQGISSNGNGSDGGDVRAGRSKHGDNHSANHKNVSDANDTKHHIGALLLL